MATPEAFPLGVPGEPGPERRGAGLLGSAPGRNRGRHSGTPWAGLFLSLLLDPPSYPPCPEPPSLPPVFWVARVARRLPASSSSLSALLSPPHPPRPREPQAQSLCPFSFPGGKSEPADRDVVHTALRETQEELGLAVSEEQVWGLLHPVFDQSKASVVPVLASVGPLDLQSLRPNSKEVDEVFVLPVDHLLQTRNQGYTHFCQGGHFSYTLPVFLHGPHRVWGLTAVITEFTLQLLAPGTYQPRLVSPKPPRD
ncbi:nucleoside diphosphate-linked moiety X motif 8 isoform X1 [Dipodomys spectabilis]|uniref:nucleoside diphosphate-linked moiety X motif 8 isoform X1 n=1 Tax=Dipodomys spectabilis TaxID=105255 RepID=UPI001C540D02|nr:nucleoside diphosphate-linked moiety X motif 8 isoform X1 [Dipodomys spectabilis]